MLPFYMVSGRSLYFGSTSYIRSPNALCFSYQTTYQMLHVQHPAILLYFFKQIFCYSASNWLQWVTSSISLLSELSYGQLVLRITYGKENPGITRTQEGFIFFINDIFSIGDCSWLLLSFGGILVLRLSSSSKYRISLFCQKQSSTVEQMNVKVIG